MSNGHTHNMDEYLTDSESGDRLFVHYRAPDEVECCDLVVRFDPQDSCRVITQEARWMPEMGDYCSTHIDLMGDQVWLEYLPLLCESCGEEGQHPTDECPLDTDEGYDGSTGIEYGPYDYGDALEHGMGGGDPDDGWY